MKKLVITTAAAVALLATPLAGKASAAEYKPVQANKVVNFKVSTSDFKNNDWCAPFYWNFKEITKKQPIYNFEKPAADKTTPAKPVAEKPAPEQKPVQKPVQQKPAEAKPQAPASSQTNSQLSAFEQQVVELTNQERAKNGLPALKVDLELSKVAKEKSRDMSANKYFDHNSPTYGSPFDMMKKFGITYRSAGENIAMGQRSPQEVVNGWMNSDGHRANILSKNFTHIGVGHDANGNYWTQQFIGK